MNSPTKMPRPIRIQRKLTLASEQVLVMTTADAPLPRCTRRLTGCPIHTC